MRNVLLGIVTALATCVACGSPPRGDGSPAMAAREPVVVGRPFPALRLPEVAGQASLDLPSRARRPTVVLALAGWDDGSRALADAWDAATEDARARDELRLVGVALDQHPERCEVLARARGWDWPVLWDPFDLLELEDVPRAFLLDADGRVAALDPAPEAWRAALAATSPDASAATPAFDATRLAREFGLAEEQAPFVLPQLASASLGTTAAGAWAGLSQLLLLAPWTFDAATFDAGVQALETYLDGHPDDAWARFRLGVALRLRFDRGPQRPGDFAAAVAAWREAAALRPTCRVFAQRAAQYGPHGGADAPYAWFDDATDALLGRGEVVPALLGRPTLGETGRASSATAPDAGRAAASAARVVDDDWFTIEVVAVPEAAAAPTRTRMHVGFRPAEQRAVAWCNRDGPLVATIDERSLADGVAIEHARLVAGGDPSPRSEEVRWVEFDVVHPPGESVRVRLEVAVAAAAGSGDCVGIGRICQLVVP